jgi:DNA mismatch repair protein MutL
MAKIKQLSPHEAQKIAAGEVVERPCNIIKELVENAIDAGATRITIHVEDGGKESIRIIDNGCGMDSIDAHACFARHATSKITCVDELDTLTTFGFRGEALASIASVSTINLITTTEHSLEGTHVTTQSGNIVDSQSVACATGTDIAVTDLFANIPARKKFLKSTQTELRTIQLLFNAFCFDYPHIHFSLFSDGKQIANCPATTNLLNRALQLWEPSIHNHLLTIASTTNDITIEGIISDHQQYRYDRSNIYFLVNKRWVKNHHLTSAFIKGYANVMPNGRYPLAAIALTVPPHEVDINIHPRKEEVKFLHPRRVEQALQNAVKAALEKNISAHLKKEVHFAITPSIPFAPPSMPFMPFIQQKKFAPVFTEPQLHIIDHIQPSTVAVQPDPDVLPTENMSMTDFPQHFRLIGQYNATYILIEKEEGLFLVDQHAAHERILYELFSQRFAEVATTQLLFPQTITLSPDDITIITPHLTLFTANGIIMEQCAHDQLIIQSLPVHLKDQSLTDIIKEMILWITEHTSLEHEMLQKTINNKLQAQMACKAAVKAGDILTHEKMEELLQTLEKTANRFSCPHGRPTGWLLSLHEIEKKFKRRF